MRGFCGHGSQYRVGVQFDAPEDGLGNCGRSAGDAGVLNHASAIFHAIVSLARKGTMPLSGNS